MQVDPIKPTLKAPGIELVEHKYVKPLSKFAFKLKLRRYNKAGYKLQGSAYVVNKLLGSTWLWAGAYTRSLFSST